MSLWPGSVNGATASADEINDFHAIAVADESGHEGMPLENHEIMLDCDAPRVDLQPFEQLLHRQRLVDRVWLPVERNAQGRGGNDCTLGR